MAQRVTLDIFCRQCPVVAAHADAAQIFIAQVGREGGRWDGWGGETEDAWISQEGEKVHRSGCTAHKCLSHYFFK